MYGFKKDNNKVREDHAYVETVAGLYVDLGVWNDALVSADFLASWLVDPANAAVAPQVSDIEDLGVDFVLYQINSTFDATTMAQPEPSKACEIYFAEAFDDDFDLWWSGWYDDHHDKLTHAPNMRSGQ